MFRFFLLLNFHFLYSLAFVSLYQEIGYTIKRYTRFFASFKAFIFTKMNKSQIKVMNLVYFIEVFVANANILERTFTYKLIDNEKCIAICTSMYKSDGKQQKHKAMVKRERTTEGMKMVKYG